MTKNVSALARLVRFKAEIMMQQAYRINFQEEAGIGQIEEILKQAKDAINQAERSTKQAGTIAVQAEVLRLKHILITNNIEYDVWEDEQYATFLKD